LHCTLGLRTPAIFTVAPRQTVPFAQSAWTQQYCFVEAAHALAATHVLASLVFPQHTCPGPEHTDDAQRSAPFLQ